MQHGQRGEGKLGFVISALFVIGLAVFSWEYLPVRIARAELVDFMEEQAKFATKATPRQIRKSILDKAQALNLPVEAKQVQVQKNGGRVRMRVTYTVPLEFPGYTWDYEVDDVIDRPTYIF